MATSTIALIVLLVIAALLVVGALAWAWNNKRTEHRRAQAGEIRAKAAEQSHEVGQREALADETAAKSRAARAEAEALAARAAGLEHQAQERRSDAVTARDEVNREYERADKVDPRVESANTPREDNETRDTPAQHTADEEAPPRMTKAG